MPMALAPARKNSRASFTVVIPPCPIIGMFFSLHTWYTCQVFRSAMGLMAGPESPPWLVPITGVCVSRSTAIPVMVLITAKASLPAATHWRAFSTMSVWFGESLVMSGLSVSRRHAATTCADISG